MSTDYILCLTENRNHPNTELTELHLSDDMVELLKSGRINNRLLCKIATHEDFVTLMTDTEIYVDGIATMHFNSLLEVLREQVLSKYQPVEEDTVLNALESLQILFIQPQRFFLALWITEMQKRENTTSPALTEAIEGILEWILPNTLIGP